MKIDPSDLQLVLLPGKRPPKTLTDHYLKAYQFWNELQLTTAPELPLTSEEFTKHQAVLALFYQGRCMAICFDNVESGPVSSCDSFWKEQLIGLSIKSNIRVA